MYQAKERFRALLEEADLMQGFADRICDGLLCMPANEQDELRVVAEAYTPRNCEEAAARAMLLWLMDHPEEDADEAN